MRQSRERRNRDVKVRLTARDELLLEAVNRFRIARTRDLLAVVFPDVHPMTASVRIRRLFDAGFLHVRCADRSAENIYSLGPLGRKWAEGAGTAVGRAPRGGVEHHLAIVRVWAGIAGAVQRWPTARVELARTDWELREDLGQAGLAIVPDLFAVLSAETATVVRTVALAVEADLGTESLRVLAQKLGRYTSLADSPHGLFGHRGFGLAVALANPGREAAVRRLLDQRWPGWWLVWLEANGPGEAMVEVMAELKGSEGAPVTDSRNGNGARVAVTRDVSIESRLAQGEH